MRAAIFIDGGYFLNQLKARRLQPNYEGVADYFLKPLRASVPLDLMRCYFYYCPPWISEVPTEDEKRRLDSYEEFVEELESLDRWAIRQGKLEKRYDGKKEYFAQKRVDVLLSCDLVRHAAAGHIQHAVLVAGDSDFIPAVEAAKDSGVTITLFTGDDNTVHNDLILLADEVHQLDWKKFPLQKVENNSKQEAKQEKPRARAASAKKQSSAVKPTQKRESQLARKRVDRGKNRRDAYDPGDVAAMKRELGLLTGRIKQFIKGDPK